MSRSHRLAHSRGGSGPVCRLAGTSETSRRLRWLVATTAAHQRPLPAGGTRAGQYRPQYQQRPLLAGGTPAGQYRPQYYQRPLLAGGTPAGRSVPAAVPAAAVVSAVPAASGAERLPAGPPAGLQRQSPVQLLHALVVGLTSAARHRWRVQPRTAHGAAGQNTGGRRVGQTAPRSDGTGNCKPEGDVNVSRFDLLSVAFLINIFTTYYGSKIVVSDLQLTSTSCLIKRCRVVGSKL